MGRWELWRVGMDHWELWRVGMGCWELCSVGMGHWELWREQRPMLGPLSPFCGVVHRHTWQNHNCKTSLSQHYKLRNEHSIGWGGGAALGELS